MHLCGHEVVSIVREIVLVETDRKRDISDFKKEGLMLCRARNLG
jgi:hypothetical protein